MKGFLLLISFVFIFQVSNGNQDSSISLIPVELLENEKIKNDVLLILKDKVSDSLYSYKRKNNKYVIMNTHKGVNFQFFTTISNGIYRSNRSDSLVLTEKNKERFISDIRFFHRKYMLLIDNNLCDLINEEIRNVFKDTSTNYSINGYVSKDYEAHYLHIQLKNAADTVNYIIIVKKSQFYNCVTSRS